MKRMFLLAVAAAAALTLTARAGSLGIGDDAPELKASKWVKGSEVSALDAKQTYVVEFWATWCGPCRASIPHLTEMAHHFTNITFIGMDVWEQGASQAAKETTVEKFLKTMGDKMDYHVAMDTTDTFMANNWMKAAGQNGIPTAFVVREGKIAWIGHPMGGLEETLKEIQAGKYSLETARKRGEAQKKVEAFFEKAMKGGDEAELETEGKALEALDQEMGGLTPGEKFDYKKILKQAKFQSAMQAYQGAVLGGKEEADVAKFEAAARAVAPEGMDFDAIKKRLEEYSTRNKNMRQVQQVFKKYVEAVGENGDKEKAAELVKQIDDLKIKEPMTLNELAWTILTDENIKTRDLALATRFAKAAVDLSEGKQAAVLDTYAHALFDSGKIADAVECQKKAVAACDDDTEKAELQASLKKYEEAAKAK